MRSRLPTVWSSRWSVKVAALSTLVSFSREILQAKQDQNLTCQVLPRTPSHSCTNRTQDARCALRHALRHHKLLVTVRRIHCSSRTASGGLRWAEGPLSVRHSEQPAQGSPSSPIRVSVEAFHFFQVEHNRD